MELSWISEESKNLHAPIPAELFADAEQKAKAAIASVTIPKSNPVDSNGSSPQTPKTPKTPADEGIEFFESVAIKTDQPIHVYELRLDPDGGPNKDRAVEYLHLSLQQAHAVLPLCTYSTSSLFGMYH